MFDMGLFDGSTKKKIQNKNLFFSNQWQFYLRKNGNAHHFVRFDIAVENLTEDERKQYPHIIELQIPYISTDDQSEWKRLKKVEDNFSHGAYNVRLIGALTYGDYRYYIFCCDGTDEDVNNTVQTLMSANKDIEFSFEIFFNNNLDYYDKTLAPSLYEKNWMENRNICDHLEEKGETFNKPRAIDFFCYFASTQHIQDIADKLHKQGFNELNQEKSEDGEYLLHLTLEGIPSHDWINEITNGIINLMEGTDGYFDGWGCTVEKNEET